VTYIFYYIRYTNKYFNVTQGEPSEPAAYPQRYAYHQLLNTGLDPREIAKGKQAQTMFTAEARAWGKQAFNAKQVSVSKRDVSV
jgi:hypothetical protein